MKWILPVFLSLGLGKAPPAYAGSFANSAGEGNATVTDFQDPATADTSATAMAATAGEASGDAVRRLLDRLAGDEEGRLGAVEALVALNDPGLHGFLENLFKGNVYLLPSGRPVVAGPEVLEGDALLVPLFAPYPFEPLLDARGGRLLHSWEDLAELETDRQMRAAIQPFLTAMELRDSLPEKRAMAARNLAASGDFSLAPLLREALDMETDPSTARFVREALFRLELNSPDPLQRLKAAQGLGDIHAVSAVSELEAMVTPDGQGGFPEQEPVVREAVNKSLASIRMMMRVAGGIHTVFSGVSLGSILILMALGLAIIFGLMGVINMAHGEFMMIGAYATYTVQNLFAARLPEAHFGWFFPASLPVAFLAAAAFGLLAEIIIVRRLYGRPLETLLATWGLSLLLIQGARHLFGDLTSVSSPPLLSRGWEIFPSVVLPYNRLFIIALTAAVVALMALLFYRTELGLKIRAVTQNRSMSGCLGIRTRRVDALTFALGTGIAGVAGWAMTQVGNVDPGMGQNYIVDSFLVVVTGGVGKLAGTLFSGLGIGVLNKLIEPQLQAVYAKVALLAMVILFLQQKPSGLFPAKGRYEEN